MKFKTIIFVIIFCLTLTTVMAHPGKTDNSGGHTCKTNCGKWGLDYGEYHFHGTSSITTPTVTTNQTTEPNLEKNKNKSESRFFENIFGWLKIKILPLFSIINFESITTDTIQVHFIDVGQGAAILIETPNHEAILIDGGDNGKGSIVSDYLQKEGIENIDFLIATHPHADNIGGLDEIMASTPVLTVYDNGETATTETYMDYIYFAKTQNYQIIKRGFQFTLDNVLIQILNPSILKSNSNDNSIVIKVTFGTVDFLITGDCEIKCEQDILKSGFNVDSEILTVGHHGSKTSTSQDFLNSVTPNVAVISVGSNNKYGHPHQETLNKLYSIDYYRTDIHGTVVIEANTTYYWVISEK